jgi:2-keto-4-pentenoate hydratase
VTALTDEQRDAAARSLLGAETNRAPTDPISTRYPGADVEDAYRISMAVTELKLALGRTIKGHKIGLTSKPMQQLAGTDEPDYGSLFDDWFVPEGSTVDMARLNHPLVEVEIAFVLGAALSGRDNNAADVIRATDFILPAIELVDSISDAASCGLVVLGSRPTRLTDLDPRREGAALYKNGTVEETGAAAAVMGSPVNAVVWLANKLGEFGVPIEAGNVILSGSFLKAIPFTAGDTIAALFDTLGDVTFATA